MTSAEARNVGPAIAARFSITIDGHEIATFSELGGISSGADPSELGPVEREKLPGKRVPPTVTLKRGLTADTDVWRWHEDARDTVAARKDAELVIYAVDGRPIARYHLESAWPAKIEIGALKAGSSEVLMETVVIVAEQLRPVAV